MTTWILANGEQSPRPWLHFGDWWWLEAADGGGERGSIFVRFGLRDDDQAVGHVDPWRGPVHMPGGCAFALLAELEDWWSGVATFHPKTGSPALSLAEIEFVFGPFSELWSLACRLVLSRAGCPPIFGSLKDGAERGPMPANVDGGWIDMNYPGGRTTPLEPLRLCWIGAIHYCALDRIDRGAFEEKAPERWEAILGPCLLVRERRPEGDVAVGTIEPWREWLDPRRRADIRATFRTLLEDAGVKP